MRLILVLLIANAAGIVLRFCSDHDHIRSLIRLVDFSAEKNIPTLYSSSALLVAGVLLSVIALAHKRRGSSSRPWSALAVIFLFLAIDETVLLHERVGGPIREALGTSGLLFFAWVIPYGIALVVFVIVYSRFLLRLPRRIGVLFGLSGGVYVAGAIGFEMLGGRHYSLYGRDDLGYAVLYTCEDLLEMLGVAIFIYALLLYIADELKCLTISVTERRG